MYAFQTVSDADAGEAAEDFVMAFNLGGIRLSPSAFEKLRTEISLEPAELKLPELWGSEQYRLYCALVSVDNDIFRKIVLRESRVAPDRSPQFHSAEVDRRSPTTKCAPIPEIYAALDGEKASAAGRP